MKLLREDWHQEWCDGQCETLYCKEHRYIYQSCHSASIYCEYEGWIELQNEGRCQYCVSDMAYKHLEVVENERIIKVA